MKRFLLILPICLIAAGCATAPPPPAAPGGGIGPLPVDPRFGYAGSPSEEQDARRYERAMRDLAAGRTAEARERLAAITGYPPAALALGALALAQGDAATAAAAMDRAVPDGLSWLAAEFYRAELAAERGELDAARAILRQIASDPAAPPVVGARLAAVEARRFDELYAAALAAEPAAAVASIRRALEIRPQSNAARLLLVQKLLAAGEVAQARVEIDPLLRSAEAERVEVQQALAEIDAGRRRYEEAIARYERIVTMDPRPEYVRRLEELKRAFAAANMPPRFRVAAASPALTRAELAVLTYWIVSDVRFARITGQPPVAIDLVEANGRDELVRAIALRLVSVDPATRRVHPDRVVSAAEAARFLLRVLSLRGTPSCAAGTATNEAPLRALAACGIREGAVALDPAAPVSGAWAQRSLERIDAILSGEE